MSHLIVRNFFEKVRNFAVRDFFGSGIGMSEIGCSIHDLGKPSFGPVKCVLETTLAIGIERGIIKSQMEVFTLTINIGMCILDKSCYQKTWAASIIFLIKLLSNTIKELISQCSRG